MKRGIRMDNNKQTTETYAVKLDPEVKSELQELIREYNTQGTQGDFIRLMVETFKTNKLNNTIVDSKADLRELNTLTTRIYNIYSNLIEKNSSSIEGLKADINVTMETKDLEITKLKENIENLKENNNLKIEELEQLEEQNRKLSYDLDQAKDMNFKDSILISRLNGEVDEIKSLRAENKVIKKDHKEVEESLSFMTNTNKELQVIINSNEAEIDGLTTQLEVTEAQYKEELDDGKSKHKEEIEDIKAKHKRELENLKQDLKSEKAKEILKLKEGHQKEVKELQDKNFEDREKIQDKYNERLDKMELLQIEVQELKNKLNEKKD